jgi:hypothetical protein
MEAMSTSPHRHRSVHLLAAVAAAACALSTSACAGTTGGEEGPVEVSSEQPASGAVPALGSATVGPVTTSGVTLQGSGTHVAVLGQITSTTADQLVSVASNLTETTVLPQPLDVRPGKALALDPAGILLRPVGGLDDGATVAVTFTFRTVGPVQVFATYKV